MVSRCWDSRRLLWATSVIWSARRISNVSAPSANAPGSRLSTSTTPTSSSPIRIGAAISDRMEGSAMMYPSNFVTSGTMTGFMDRATMPVTPLPIGTRPSYSGMPNMPFTTRSSPSRRRMVNAS